MRIILNDKYHVLLTLLVLCLSSPIVSANNSVVLLVEQPVVENLPLTIATSQSALQNFIKKNGDQTEIAVISYSTTADVIKPFAPLSANFSTELADDLKKSGARIGNINTASGMERAIALLNTDANADNTKILLVVSDANISTGDKELDVQFTEWLTEIISEDAVKSDIDVSWHPITRNANHDNIDAFLERLNGQRVVLSPAPDLIDEAAKPQAPSEAELQLELITSQLENTADNASIASEAAAIAEEAAAPAPEQTIEPLVLVEEPAATVLVPEAPIEPEAMVEPERIVEQPPAVQAEDDTSLVAEPLEIPPAREPPLTTTAIESDLENSESFPEEQASELLSTGNIKIAVLLIIALAAIFLLKTLLSKRRDSQVSGTGLADRDYKDSSDIAIAASSVAPVTTRANAPIIPERTPAPAPASKPEPIPTPVNLDDPEPIPTPLGNSDTNEKTADDAMDGTQEVFPEFASSPLLETASLEEPVLNEPEPELEINENPPPIANNSSTAQPENTAKEVDPYATVIAEAPDFSAMAGEETILADEPEVSAKAQAPLSDSAQSNDKTPPIDPYATVIADASQIQAYAKQFSEDGTPVDLDADKAQEEHDPDKTVLYQPNKDK